MKTTKLILSGLAATAAFLSNSFAQSTVAVTDPVGYVTMPVVQASGAAPGVSFIGATLVNKVEAQGEIASAGAASSVTLPSAPPTVANNSIGQPLYYIEITSGAEEGKWTNIVSAAGNTLTLSDPIGGMFTVGTKYIIRMHQTFNALFGSLEANVAVVAGADIFSADELQILGAGGAPTSYFFSTDDLAGLGWLNVKTGLAAGDEVIAPGDGIKLIRRSATVKPGIVQVGHVKTGKTQLVVETGVNYITVPQATGWAATDATFTGSGLVAGVDLFSADNLETFSVGVGTTFYSSSDDLNPGLLPGNFTANEGTSMRVTRRGAAFNMTLPAQVIQN